MKSLTRMSGVFSARSEIDQINSDHNVELLSETEAYDTLGGLVIYHLESIPTKGTVLELENHSLIIEAVSDRRIETVRIIKR